MGDENKQPVSFLKRNGVGPPPPAAQAAVAPPPPMPQAPAAPQGLFGQAPAQGPSALFKKAPPAAPSLPSMAPPPPSSMRSATMQSGKLKAPGAKSALTATGMQKMSAIRPSFSNSAPSVPGLGTLAPNNVGRAPGQQMSALISGAVPLSNAAPPFGMTQTGSMGAAIRQAQADPQAEHATLDAPRPGMQQESPRTQADALLQQGLDHYDRGEHELALAAYNEAIQVDPSFAMAYNNLGMVLIDLERYSDAMATLYESIRLDGDYGEAYNNLGFVLRRLGNNLEAASAYRRFLDLEPEVEEGERIAEWIDTVLDQNGLSAPPPLTLPAPQNLSGQFVAPPKIKKMAAWEAAAGDQDMAAPVDALGQFATGAFPRSPQAPGIQVSQRLSALQPSPGMQVSQRMAALPQGPNVSQRVPVLPPAPLRKPGDPLSPEDHNRVVALVEKSLDEFAAGNLDEALNLAGQALDIDAESGEAHTAMGKILVRQEKHREGIEHLERAIQLAPLDPSPYYVLGFTLRATDRNVEAAEIYETFLRLMPDAMDAAKMRQWIQHVKGISEADASPENESEDFIDHEPIITESDKLYLAALEKFRTCSALITIDDCERILAEAPDHVRTRLLLGRAFMREGEFEKATQSFEKVLELYPGFPEALYFIGQSFEKSGDSPRALKAYRRYLEESPDGPRNEKLRAWFLAHGVEEPGKGLSKQIQCEWCLRFFDEGQISLHEGKTTCNGCLELMGSTPIQDSNKLETVDATDISGEPRAKQERRHMLLVKLGFGLAAIAAAAIVAFVFLGPYFKVEPKGIRIAEKVVDAAPDLPLDPNKKSGETVPFVVPIDTTAKKAPQPTLNFDGTKVKISNAPDKEFSVFSRWTWKPEYEGVDELNRTLPGWKTEFVLGGGRPLGMGQEGDMLVWNSDSKDFEALKHGEKYTVDLTVTGFWIGPDMARRDLFKTSKTFTVSSQFGYDIGPEMDIGMSVDARNIGLLGMDADGDGLRDLIVTNGSIGKGAVRTVYCGPDGSKRNVLLAEGGRYSGSCAFPLNGNDAAGVLAANWQSGEVKLFLVKKGRLEAGPTVKFSPGIVSVAAMEIGKNKTAIAALSSSAGTLSMALYEPETGFGKVSSVPMSGGGNGQVLAWRSADLGPGFLAIAPLAEEPLRFVPWAASDAERAATVRSALKFEGVITASARVSTAADSHRLALVLGGKTSRLLVMEEKSGKFTPVGSTTTLPGPGLGVVAWDFNHDGNDDLFVVTRDEACFYFLGDTGTATAGPHFPNPGMLGPVVLLGYANSARPDIAVLNENKKARIFKPVGSERTTTAKNTPALEKAAEVGEAH